MKTEEVVVEIYSDRTEMEVNNKSVSTPNRLPKIFANSVILSETSKSNRKVYPTIEFHYGVEFASIDKDLNEDKDEIRNISSKEHLPLKDTLSVPREIYSMERTEVITKIDDLWCGNSTENCVTTCATVDFFLASLKSAWIAIVLILLYKSSLMNPSSNSLMDFIMNENRKPNATSSLAVCLLTQELPRVQRKIVLVIILIMGFPILPLEFLLTKSIFFATEMKNRVKITMWLVTRGLLLVIFVTQALYKYTCFVFEHFDLITVPEIIYRVYELHVVAKFLSEILHDKDSFHENAQ